jgi:predicted nucleic acid-binding protein
MPVADTLVAAVADAGPLIHLDELGVLGFLCGFAEVLVPAIVIAEVTRHRPAWRASAPRCVREADATPQSLRSIQEEGLATGLDPGEVAALALWRERPDSILLCDDLAARRVADRMGCEVAGTVGLVLWAARTNLVSRAEAGALLRSVPHATSLHIRADILVRALADLDTE